MIYKFKEHKKSELFRSHLNMGGAAPSGERIDVTSLYLERGGKPWIGVMGEFHFSRCERGEWHREMRRSFFSPMRNEAALDDEFSEAELEYSAAQPLCVVANNIVCA